MLRAVMEGYKVVWPADVRGIDNHVTHDHQIFDLLEFTYEHVALPVSHGFHSYFGHHHFEYDQEAGQRQFADEVNRLFERNGVAFQLKDGQVERLVALSTSMAWHRNGQGSTSTCRGFRRR